MIEIAPDIAARQLDARDRPSRTATARASCNIGPEEISRRRRGAWAATVL